MSEKPLNKVIHSGYGPNDIENSVKELNEDGNNGKRPPVRKHWRAPTP